MPQVQNAIIMAAGCSRRFAPLSYEKPKGLWRVKGEILIEREIGQLNAAGIDDITVVVGYCKEQFYYLREKYGVELVVNEDYQRYNNCSTLMRVLDRISSTYICSSDNYFTENVFESEVSRAYYAASYSSGKTGEWCLETDDKGRIKEVTVGGEGAWYMLGHAYFSPAFSARFKEILSREYASRKTREELWEALYARYVDKLDLYIRKYGEGKVWEFDSLEELRTFDETYIDHSGSEIMQRIANILHCREGEIRKIRLIEQDPKKRNFSFCCGAKRYIYLYDEERVEEQPHVYRDYGRGFMGA